MSLHWKDQPLRELVRLAWPMTVSMVSYSVMTLVDTLLLGHIGRAELAGVGLAGISSFVLLCFSFGLLQGAKVMVAQSIGANRPEEARAYLAAAISVGLGLGVLTVGLGQILAIFIGHLASTEAAGAAARTYMRIRVLGAPLVLLYAALREVRQAEGDSRTPMLATVAANIVNTALAVFFIFVLKMGVAAAACATLIAHSVEAGIMVLSQRSRGWGFGRLRRAHLVELMRVGVPTGLQFMLEVGAFATLSLDDLAFLGGRDGGAPNRAAGDPLLVPTSTRGGRSRRGTGRTGGGCGALRAGEPRGAHGDFDRRGLRPVLHRGFCFRCGKHRRQLHTRPRGDIRKRPRYCTSRRSSSCSTRPTSWSAARCAVLATCAMRRSSVWSPPGSARRP